MYASINLEEHLLQENFCLNALLERNLGEGMWREIWLVQNTESAAEQTHLKLFGPKIELC